MDQLDEIMEIVDGEPQMTDGNTPEAAEEEYEESVPSDKSEASNDPPKQSWAG